MGNKFFMARFTNVKDVLVFNDYVGRKPMKDTSHNGKTMFNKDKSSSSDNICDTHIDGA